MTMQRTSDACSVSVRHAQALRVAVSDVLMCTLRQHARNARDAEDSIDHAIAAALYPQYRAPQACLPDRLGHACMFGKLASGPVQKHTHPWRQLPGARIQ